MKECVTHHHACARHEAIEKALRWIASQENLFFTECTQAEEIIARARAALALPEDSIRPIDRDEEFDRTYIPLPGGWEVQTKGKGSTFRICDPSGRRLAIPPSPYLHETLERMAREIHAAMVRPVNGDSKTVNAELYKEMQAWADENVRQEIDICKEYSRLGLPIDEGDIARVDRIIRYLELREASGEPMPYKVIRDGDKVRFE